MKFAGAAVSVGIACLVQLICSGCESSSPGFDEEVGEWREFDLQLSPALERPGPTVITDCDVRIVVYSVATADIEDCAAFGAVQGTFDAAVRNALDYFDTEFRCEDPRCIRKVGRVLWAGWSCDEDLPREAIAAVLVEMWCEVEE